MSIAFISDLHLSPAQPQLLRLFEYFLSTTAKSCESLYILGDFFAYWIGDDVAPTFSVEVAAALRQIHAQGTRLYFMPGNRDFLIGPTFLSTASLEYLPDPFAITLAGQNILLSHGDALCSSDVNYQKFRRVVRHPLCKKLFLHSPSKLRQKCAEYLREKSRDNFKKAPYHIDVTWQTARTELEKYQCTCLIHGHTHIPLIELHPQQDKCLKRYALADWTPTQGNYLLWDDKQFTLNYFSL